MATLLGHEGADVSLCGTAHVQVSRPHQLSQGHERLIRHAGWLFSIGLASAGIALCASLGLTTDVLLLGGTSGSGAEEVAFAVLGIVLVALEAVHSDLLSKDHVHGRFNCGNFGLLLLRQAQAGRVDALLRRMLQITMMRGAQSAGVVTYQKAVGRRHRVVNGKRTDLSNKLLDRARSITKPASVHAPQLFQGHTRFATSSIADLGGTHPHQWTPRQMQPHWSSAPGAVGMRCATANVEAYITHNGDLDFFELHGIIYPLGDVQTLLIALLHAPMPATVDSMCVAGLLELHRAKGLWRAAVRFGYVYGALRYAGDLAALAKQSGLWPKERLLAVASAFEEQWAALLARNAADGIAGTGESAASGVTADVERAERAGSAAALAASLSMESLRAEFIDVMEYRMRQQLRAGDGSGLSDDALTLFVDIDAFLHNDLNTATRQLLRGARGSFGLVCSHSLDSTEELVVAARGQTMSIAVYPQMGVVLFGSEAAATKVGMGLAINADLLNEDDFAQMHEDDSTAGTGRVARLPSDARSDGKSTSRSASLSGSDGGDGTDVASPSAPAAAAIVKTNQRRARSARRKFGAVVSPLTGDALQAMMKLACDVSGATYALYWVRSGTHFVVTATFVSEAHAATPNEGGCMFVRASRDARLDATTEHTLEVRKESSVETSFRTGRHAYLADAANTPSFRRATAASRYGIQSIYVLPIEGGVIELGKSKDDATQWGAVPPKIDLPGAAIRALFDGESPHAGAPSPLGANGAASLKPAYVRLWEKRGDEMHAVAGYTTAAHRQTLRAVRGSDAGIESQGGVAMEPVPLGGSHPISQAMLSKADLAVDDAAGSVHDHCASLAREWGIRAVTFTPLDGGILLMEHGAAAPLPSTPPQEPLTRARLGSMMPSRGARRSHEEGGTGTTRRARRSKDDLSLATAPITPSVLRRMNTTGSIEGGASSIMRVFRRSAETKSLSEGGEASPTRALPSPVEGGSRRPRRFSKERPHAVAPPSPPPSPPGRSSGLLQRITSRGGLSSRSPTKQLDDIAGEGDAETRNSPLQPMATPSTQDMQRSWLEKEARLRRTESDPVIECTSAASSAAGGSEDGVQGGAQGGAAPALRSRSARFGEKDAAAGAAGGDGGSGSFRRERKKTTMSCCGSAIRRNSLATIRFADSRSKAIVADPAIRAISGAATLGTISGANPLDDGRPGISSKSLAPRSSPANSFTSRGANPLAPASAAGDGAHPAHAAGSETLDDFGEVLKQSFRYDLDDLNGEVVLLRWGAAAKPPESTAVDSNSKRNSKRRASNETMGDTHGTASTPLTSARDNDVTATLMRFGPGLTSRLQLTSHIEGKDNAKLGSPLRRLLQLDGSKFVTPLPRAVSDPVGKDLRDLPAVLAKIMADWDRPQDSHNRMSAWTFTHLLRARMKLHDENNHDGSVDVLVSGCEVSLWVGEQFAADLHRVFPKLRIVTLSANKLLGQLGQSFPIPQTNFSFNAGSHDLTGSLCLLLSHSGGTFATLACSNLLKSFTPYIFAVTSEWDTQVARSIRSGVGDRKTKSLQESVRSYVFVTHVGLRPAEPCTVSVVATHQILTQLLIYIMYYLRHFDADGHFAHTCGSVYVREEVCELAQLNEANLAAVREIIGGPVEMPDGTMQISETATSKRLRSQGHRWAQHVLEGPISWAMSATYIFATVVGGGTPLTALLLAIQAASSAPSAVAADNGSLASGVDFAAANAALMDMAGGLDDNATVLAAARLLTDLATMYPAARVLEGQPAPEAPGWAAAGYIVAALDALIYLFLPWWTTVLLRLLQGRPWLHRVAGRSVLIGDVPYVSQAVEAFASKLFALAYKNATIAVASGNPVDHLVHRHTHRVVRGCLLAVGRPDGRLNALTSAENTVCLSVNQASSIQNYGVTCESITIGHNPFALPLAEKSIQLPKRAAKFLCEKELELELSTKAGGETPPPADTPARRGGFWWRFRMRRRTSASRARSIYGSELDRSRHDDYDMDSSRGSKDDSKHGANPTSSRLGYLAAVPTMSASALMGAMEGLFHSTSELDDAGEPRARQPATLAMVLKDLTVAKELRDSVRKHTAKPAGGGVQMFKRVEPIKEPFIGAWMATSPELRKLSTVELFARQQLLQELYESRLASMQRLVAFFVMFHAMGKRVMDFWPKVSCGLLGYDMSRTQSIMRIATTASPVSGMEVRLRVLELQREQELAHGARTVQRAVRFRKALTATDEALMAMMYKGQITQGQLAQLVVLRAERSGKAGMPDGSNDRARHPLTNEERALIIESLRGCTALHSLGPQRTRAAVEFFEPIDFVPGQAVITQGETDCRHFYIVGSGEFDVFLKQAGPRQAVATLRPGKIFGEASLLHNVPRAATVKCRVPGIVWALDWKVLRFLMMGKSLRKTDLAASVLEGVPLLAGLTEEQRDVFASEMELVELGGDEEIASEGALAEAFYIVTYGGVVLSRRKVRDDGHGLVDEQSELCRLQAPSHMGAHSLDYSPAREEEVTSPTWARTQSRSSRQGCNGLAASSGSAAATSPSGGGRSCQSPRPSPSKGARPPTARRMPPPIWGETITTDPDYPITRLLWMSRERAFELLGGHLSDVVRRNAIDKTLREAPAFADFSRAQTKVLAKRFEPTSHAAGATIYAQGEPGEHLYVVLKGRVRLSVADTLVSAAENEERHATDTTPRVHLALRAGASGWVGCALQVPAKEVASRVLRDVSAGADAAFGEAALFTRNVAMPLRAETAVAVGAVELLCLSNAVLAELPKSGKSNDQDQMRRRKERRRKRAQTLHRNSMELVAHLGTGSFGRVSLVHKRGSEQVFALKSMAKGKLVAAKQVTNAISEKRVLDMIEHPFCCSLATVFSDPEPHGDVHILMEACLGGELFSLLRLAGCFDCETTRFYGACVAAALTHLHEQCIAYRDLKPENIVIDRNGFIQLIDFGFAKVLRNAAKTFTLCGTPQYLAPELVTSAGHGLAVDWWACGVLMYEMLHGAPPFNDATSMGVYQRILAGKVAWAQGMRSAPKELIQKLLVANPAMRLGHQKVVREPFFRPVDFESLERKEIPPPWVPSLQSATDTAYYANASLPEEDEEDMHSDMNGFLKEIGRLDAEFLQL